MILAGLISEAEERPDPELDDQRRRYYRLTGLGVRVLDSEIAPDGTPGSRRGGRGVPSRGGTSNRRAVELISEWVYRALLVLYPSEHRREYEEQMVQLFGDRMRRDGGGYRTAIVWFDILSDLFHSALNEHLERSGFWRVVKALLFPLFSSRYSIQKAQTNGEVAGSLLIPWLVPAIFTGVALIASPFVADTDKFRAMFVNTGVITLMVTTFVLPLLTGMTFRLRRKYNLQSVLLAIAIYWSHVRFCNSILVSFHLRAAQ